MAEIRRKGPNRYLILVYLGRGPDGKRQYHREGFRGTLSQARLRAAELEVELKRCPGPSRAAMRLGEYLDLWLERIKPPTVSERAWQTYEWHVRKLKAHAGHLPLWGLTAGVLQEALAGLFEELPPSARKIVGTLRTALRQAVAWGYLPVDPTVGLRTPRTPRRTRPVLGPGEAARLLEALKGYRHGLAVRMLLLTGMRLGELLGLKWSDIDFARGTVTVRRAADTRGRKLKEEPKTPAAYRTLVLDAETLAMLEEHRKAAAKAKVSPLRRGEALVFENEGRPLSGNSVRRALLRALKKVGLPRIRPHDLRHSAGSILLDAGVPLATVSAFLGHSSPATTAAIWGVAAPPSVHDLPGGR
ncbi:MAG: site-specific integrase, partial [Firmicutes bacterium]|nr:site-specific integrase [Bacillota bacterium]